MVPPDPVTRQWLMRIDRAAQRLEYLIDQLVTMLSVGEFERGLDRKPADIGTIINQAVDDIRPFVELRHQQLAVDVPADLGSAAVDALKIRDSLNHLLLNAIKFTPDSGKISVSARRSDAQIAIKVEDNGLGIDPVWLPRLFEPFFTGFDVSKHSSGTFEYGKQGLGLGLSVVKAFVEMHGGRIEVQSTPGKGTAFTIYLPVGYVT
jgi:signal transduction histidine kinase